jgi:hypothetical protein
VKVINDQKINNRNFDIIVDIKNELKNASVANIPAATMIILGSIFLPCLIITEIHNV